MIPTSATDSRNRVRVRITQMALAGGSFAFADFHVTPLLGSNIATESPGAAAPPVCYVINSASRGRSRGSEELLCGGIDAKAVVDGDQV
jgi:hypothetical protein